MNYLSRHTQCLSESFYVFIYLTRDIVWTRGQSWQQLPGEMVLRFLLTILICSVESKRIPRCDNINEYSIQGAAASTQCPKCDEYYPSKKVTTE